MLASDLVKRVRHRLFDTVGKRHTHYWSDYELLEEYGNAALDKLFLGVRKLITDSKTASDIQGNPLCVLPLVASQADYPVSPKIIEINTATITEITDPVAGTTLIKPMAVMTVAEMDARYSYWRSVGAGTPKVVITDLNTDSLTVWPTPELNLNPPPTLLTPTVNLTVHRFMLRRLGMIQVGSEFKPDDSVILTFREEYHEFLVYGILAEAYTKDDGETKRPDLAALNEKKFNDKIESAKDDLSRRMRVNTGVRTRLAFR